MALSSIDRRRVERVYPFQEKRMRIARFTIWALIAIAMPQARSQQPAKPLYQNEKAPIPARVRDLLARMTLEEKVAQLQSGVNMPGLGGIGGQGIFAKDGLNEVSAKKALGTGLGTYAFLDEFL